MRGPCVYALDPTVNEAWKQGCDLWRLDLGRSPSWDPVRRGVVVSALMPNLKRERRELLLTRYSNDNRERTFFGCADAERTVKDELK